MRIWAGAASARSPSARGRLTAPAKSRAKGRAAERAGEGAGAEDYAAPIEAEDLREALARLGARVIDKTGGAR